MKIVIFGAGQFADLAEYYFNTLYDVVGRVVDAEYIKPGYVAFEEIEKAFPPEDHALFIAIGYSNLNKAREEKVEQARAKGYMLASFRDFRSYAPYDFEPEPNTFVFEANNIQPFSNVGQNVILWSGNHIGHHSTIGDNCFISSHCVISGNVTVGRNVFIGVNATIRDGVKIGDYAVIGAGALVLTDVPDYGVYTHQGLSKVPSNRLRAI